MAAQHFFLRGQYLGSRRIPDFRVIPGMEVRPHFSYALFCMRCGDVWARFVHDKAELTQVTCRPCREHGDGHLSDHPAWLDMPTRFEDDWPDAATQYEFETLFPRALEAINVNATE